MKRPQSATKRLVNSKVSAATPICGALRRHLHQGRGTKPLEDVHYDRIASGLGTASVSGHFGHHGLLYDGHNIDVDVVIITHPVPALGPPQVLKVAIKIREQVALTRCVSRSLVCSRWRCHPPLHIHAQSCREYSCKLQSAGTKHLCFR